MISNTPCRHANKCINKLIKWRVARHRQRRTGEESHSDSQNRRSSPEPQHPTGETNTQPWRQTNDRPGEILIKGGNYFAKGPLREHACVCSALIYASAESLSPPPPTRVPLLRARKARSLFSSPPTSCVWCAVACDSERRHWTPSAASVHVCVEFA